MQASDQSVDAAAIAVTDDVTDVVSDSRAAGGSRELLALAVPLVLSQSFMTVQVFIDTILLAHHDSREMAASFPR
jgi:MATE family multidrug resistance protein